MIVSHAVQIDYEEFRRFVVMLAANQLSHGGIVTSWIDSADWVAGIEYRRAPCPIFLQIF